MHPRVTFCLFAAVLLGGSRSFAVPEIATNLGARMRYDRNITLQNPDARVTTSAPNAVSGRVGSLFTWLDQDFRTRHRVETGYANYVDRADAAIGADAGRRIAPGTALVAAVRAGRQRQANLFGVPLNYSNTYTRWLGGVEGAPRPGWKLAFLAGPMCGVSELRCARARRPASRPSMRKPMPGGQPPAATNCGSRAGAPSG